MLTSGYPTSDMTKLILSDGTAFSGQSFGAKVDSDGEVVFTTNMSGYVESLTDPSFRGQVLTFTYPLIGNYGVPANEKDEQGIHKYYESDAVHVNGVVVTEVSDDFSHYTAASSLHNWLEHYGVPGITGIDTRALTKKLREHGVMLGRIVQDDSVSDPGKIEDPNDRNLMAEVSVDEVITYEPEGKVVATVAAYDCGVKLNIIRSWLKRGVRVHRLPWNFDLDASDLQYDGLFISNGPGDPKSAPETISQIATCLNKGTPTFGICMGNLLTGLAIGGDTFKLPYGHRGANQPCVEHDANGKPTDKCIITSQNHGYAVDINSIPKDWSIYFTNANDGTVEGVRHKSGKFFTVQFHPEATPGPEDAAYLFDEFIKVMKG